PGLRRRWSIAAHSQNRSVIEVVPGYQQCSLLATSVAIQDRTPNRRRDLATGGRFAQVATIFHYNADSNVAVWVKGDVPHVRWQAIAVFGGTGLRCITIAVIAAGVALGGVQQ